MTIEPWVFFLMLVAIWGMLVAIWMTLIMRR